MLKHRIIPVLLTDDMVQAVKPVAFERPYRRLGHLRQYIEVMETRNIDEILIIDIRATEDGREPKFKQFRELVSNLMCPITYGGGIRTLDHIRLALENGADKVAIKSRYNIMKEGAYKFGSQAIVGVIDSFDNYDDYYYAWSASRLFTENGAGELIVTDQNKDGLMEGYNTDLIRQVSSRVPVVALGGCGEPVHMHQALAAGASAVAAGSLFLYTEETPRSCAEFLSEMGNAVRI